MSYTKPFENFQCLFNKLAHSFVAIELFDFSKMQNSIFIAQKSSHYLGLKIPYVKSNDIFYFCVYRKISQKKGFLYIKVNYKNYS